MIYFFPLIYACYAKDLCSKYCYIKIGGYESKDSSNWNNISIITS
jgi:hypothetical protein